MALAFVTGGSGFVGRTLIARLRSEGHAVRALARSDSAARAVEEAGATAARGDLDDRDALTGGMRGCDWVFHAAALAETFGPRAEFLRINVGGTEHVLEAARAAGVRRFVHVSTEAVLVGGAPIVRADETWPRPPRPIGLYPETKGMAEERVLAANRPPLETVVCRPRAIWGRGDTSVLPRIIESIEKGQFRWIGGGGHLTSTCHVRNCAEGLIRAAERGQPGAIYFLTDGAPMPMRDFLSRQLEARGVPVPRGALPLSIARVLATVTEFTWRALNLRGAPPVDRTTVLLVGQEVTVDDSRARREIGYVGRVTFEEGIAEMRAA